MKNILTNHEMPRCMLNSYNESHNDYDFVLFHLYIKDEVYRDYFLNMRKNNPDRMMILDNSAYEMYVSGDIFTSTDFVGVIKELRPDYYIIPDVLMDYVKTVNRFDDWITNWIPFIEEVCKEGINPKPMCVPQGRSLIDFMDCFNYMYNSLKGNICDFRFCIPFHNSFFYMLGSEDNIESRKIINVLWGDERKTTTKDLTEDDKYAVGRCLLMDIIAMWETDNEILSYHLLGTHNPIELKYLSQFDNIYTYDTGYPVKLALSGKMLGKETSKPEIIIDDFFENNIENIDVIVILYNINQLRSYIGDE